VEDFSMAPRLSDITSEQERASVPSPEYFQLLRDIAAAAKAAGYVGPAVPLDPLS
jgi:hypothetical protein